MFQISSLKRNFLIVTSHDLYLHLHYFSQISPLTIPSYGHSSLRPSSTCLCLSEKKKQDDSSKIYSFIWNALFLSHFYQPFFSRFTLNSFPSFPSSIHFKFICFPHVPVALHLHHYHAFSLINFGVGMVYIRYLQAA